MSELFRENLFIDQGCNFSQNISLFAANGANLDTTGWNTSNAFIKKFYTSNTYTPFTVTIVANGIINLSLTSIQTANIYFGRFCYDILMTDNNGNSVKVKEGFVYIEGSASINQQPTPS